MVPTNKILSGPIVKPICVNDIECTFNNIMNGNNDIENQSYNVNTHQYNRRTSILILSLVLIIMIPTALIVGNWTIPSPLLCLIIFITLILIIVYVLRLYNIE